MKLKDLIQKNKVVNGYRSGYEKDPLFEKEIKPIIKKQRAVVLGCFISSLVNGFFDDETELMMGARFNSDDTVIRRMESFKEEGLEDHNGNLNDFVLDALVDCMKADYWYRFEKKWD